MHYLKILWRSFIGNLYKIKVCFHVLFNVKPKLADRVAENTIVSLTSYGRRTSKCAKYAVFSMLVQTIRPEKIILWLDQEKWNNDNIPIALKRMQLWGIFEVKYCEDVRSFTKLVPALQNYPDKVIITIDDDNYYSSNTIKNLYSAYQENPDRIYTNHGLYMKKEADGSFTPYNSWLSVTDSNIDENVVLLGYSGVLYPPHSLHQSTTNKGTYMKLCPLADDLWFHAMAKLKGTQVVCVYNPRVEIYLVDFIYQKMMGAALCYSNVDDNRNDNQLRAIYNYFNLK